ncbi:CBS domain protein [Desulfosarcina cetonica]|uniref:CBS domain-containing protein n=1 Tax=Desulfosarcina cetonica TaxID=90730 RepID=UPI000B1B054C|nr:CBS domain-containing protein [Desulfosarcina cetonica]VTR64878.1 CBS domain protein [Desulfosarcina cetonica]
MKNHIVKDLMVPISEYATVPEEATLFEAVLALEKAQEQYQQNTYSHRAVLIMDKNKKVIGKISQMDFLRALEPQDENLEQIREVVQFGFSRKAVALMQESYLKDSAPVLDVHAITARRKATEFMQRLTDGEYVDENSSLDMALHQLTAGSNLSLLVTRGKDIVGVLRLSDVFAAVYHSMKETELRKADGATG